MIDSLCHCSQRDDVVRLSTVPIQWELGKCAHSTHFDRGARFSGDFDLPFPTLGQERGVAPP